MTLKKKVKLMMKQKRIIVAVSAILILNFSSCKDNQNAEKGRVKKEGIVHNGFKNETVEFYFDFPDTVYINKVYKGNINYKSVLDTITKTFDDKKRSRYILYYMRNTKDIKYSVDELKKMELDTFGAINNKSIPIYGIKFSELGTYYLDGIIDDHVTVDTFSQKSIDKVRYIENLVRATHKVIVVNEPNIKSK